jgi:manganese transport protein
MGNLIDSLRVKMNAELHNPALEAKKFFSYIGPGLLVTVGFIDPGNWASNLAAGAEYGYQLLWMVTLSTIMLIVLQHNVAHLGIATGDCLAEAAAKNLKPWLANSILLTAVMAAVSTAMAEILGGAIALQLLFAIPIKIGTVLVLGVVFWMLFSSSYGRLEKWIIGFVSLIGLSFLFELSMVEVSWSQAAKGWITISFPEGSMLIVMSVLGAVVMPHNLFLHSEIIQSREWNKEDDAVIHRQLKYEFTDTLFSMLIGWAINSAMIILAAAAFFANQKTVEELGQAQQLLAPLLGENAAVIFGLALLFSGISSTTTAGMAGGSIVAGIFKEPYDIKDFHTKLGVEIILGLAAVLVFVVSDPFKGLIYSQMFLSVQLPITIFLQIYLTSSKSVMGKFRNSLFGNVCLWIIGVLVTVLNGLLLYSFLK